MAELPNQEENKKLFYKMSEVSKLLDVAPSLLRFWEKEFDCLKKVNKNRKGDRLYTAHNIEDLKQIKYLVKEKGFTLSGANEFMQKNNKQGDSTQEMLKSLKKLKSFFEELKLNI